MKHFFFKISNRRFNSRTYERSHKKTSKLQILSEGNMEAEQRPENEKYRKSLIYIFARNEDHKFENYDHEIRNP